ncbi:MAG: helicase-related protein [Microbacterium sp.]
MDAGDVPFEIGTRWRPYGPSNWLVTLHVRLRTKTTGEDRTDIPLMLFQVDLSARPADGASILEYDVSRAIDVDPEAAELRLRYRSRKVFAVGHGMAADWETDEAGNCVRIRLDPVPHFVVPAIEQTGGDQLDGRARPALDLALLAGMMPQSVSQATALVAAASPLLELPGVLVGTDRIGDHIDPYWTFVMYHNSLRELGRTGALLLDDINGRLGTRADRLGLGLRTVRADRVLELTSRRGPEELPKDLRQLRVSADDSDDAVDAVLSSNMLSVGIDVQRLALMLMVGQPKTTAEYIQATSRVGRGSVNGIVMTLFRSNRARDRSHFETFRGYHDALYRSVEPTSVTPWSMSSRDRSLAGALIALLRHAVPVLAGDGDAGAFDLSEDRFRATVEVLIERFLDLVRESDEDEKTAVDDQVWQLLREWDRKAREARDAGERLRYEHRQAGDRALVKRFGQTGDEWLVADSMRSVEPNVAVEVQEPEREVRRAEDPS